MCYSLLKAPLQVRVPVHRLLYTKIVPLPTDLGSNAGRDFNAFLIRMIPALVPVWLGILVILLVLFRRELHFSGDTHRGLDLDESKAIKGAHVLRRVLWAMFVVLWPFFIHHQPVATRSDVHAALAV